MKKFGIITLLMLLLLNLASADVFARKVKIDGKWHTQTITELKYNWYRNHWFGSEYERWDEYTYVDKDGNEIKVFGSCRTELSKEKFDGHTKDKDGNAVDVSRIVLVRYYTDVRWAGGN